MLDEGLIEAFRTATPTPVRAVYREYGRLVYAVAHKVPGRQDLAEDATQQAFVQAWKAAASFDPAASSARGWPPSPGGPPSTSTGASPRRSPSALDDVAPATPAVVTLPPSAEQAYDVWEVRRAIDELPAEEREVVRLQHLDGLTHAEVAVRLDVPSVP